MATKLNENGYSAILTVPVSSNGQGPTPVPPDSDEQEAVRHQLERLLAHSLFKNSARCSNLLRYTIEQTLLGEAGQIKERTLGVEVFGRPTDYDTSQDAVVRHVASDVRKRLSQYYSEAGHEGELRFEIPPGSYTVKFCFEQEPHQAPDGAPAIVVRSAAWRLGKTRIITVSSIATLLVLALVFAVLGWRRSNHASDLSSNNPVTVDAKSSALYLLWKPIFNSSAPFTVCVGESRMVEPPPDEERVAPEEISIPLASAHALVGLSSFLTKNGAQFMLEPSRRIDFDHLRRGSVILVGGPENFWVLRETENLRFHFADWQSLRTVWIEDSEHPTSKEWALFTGNNPDQIQILAIVGRFYDPYIREYVIVASGLGRYGTSLAGEFLTDPEHLNALAKNLPKDWATKNLEFVIASTFIRGQGGPLRVVAVNMW